MMIRYYIMLAWRNLLKQKMYSVIKVGGFALSIAACILISLFIHHEISYDKSYPNSENIYRIIGITNSNGNIGKGTAFPAPVTKVLKQDFPEVELAGRLLPNGLFGGGSNQVSTSSNNESQYEEGFTFIDQGLLDILQIEMVYGELSHALDEPNTVLISKAKADKYFPNQNPIGETIYLNNDKDRSYTVKGVIEDLPSTSHLRSYDFFLTLSGVEHYAGEQSNWGASNYVCYVQLKKGTDIHEFERKATLDLLENYFIPALRKEGQKNPEKLLKTAKIALQPVSDIHLKSSDIDDYKTVARGDIRFVWLFGGVAIVILLMACINFVNLSTARSANRAKEVGIRKVAGSHNGGLVKQFLLESILYSLLSFTVGLLLAWVALPLFNDLAGKNLFIPWREWWFIPVVTSSVAIIGLIAGLYPAIYLSSFKPIAVLNGKLSRGSRSPVLRSGLVVVQFTASIILIIGTFIIYKQMQFIMNEKVGFDKEQVLLIHSTNTLQNQIITFKDELNKLPEVESVSIGDYLPIRASGVKRNGQSYTKATDQSSENGVPGQSWEIDEDYIQTMGMKIVAGRNFLPNMATDSQSVVINQLLAKSLGLKNPVGSRISNGQIYTVIGVVEDFNFESLKGEIGGLALFLGRSPSMVSVKLGGDDIRKTIGSIESLWKSLSPHQTIRYTFLDEGYANMYRDVQTVNNVFTSFAILAVIIACLGLFGLAAFTTEQRVKEIGIRKVLGASVKNITQLLSRDFLKLVFISILIASPVAWWAMNTWLEDFAYRIEIQWWMFALAGVLALAIALITVSSQAIKAAIANPVDSLKDE